MTPGVAYDNAMQRKSDLDEIRRRFDNDVERFSNLETGQTATMDAALAMDLIAQTAAACCPKAARVLDIGCGAGNYTLKILQNRPGLSCTLCDLSQPMLDRARQRVSAVTTGQVDAIPGDFRTAPLAGQYDIILAAAVLHHLRDDADWEQSFQRLYDLLTPGGWLWIFDLVTHDHPAVHAIQWQRYGQYLADFKDSAYRDKVFAYIQEEDSPRGLMYQLDLMRRVGFTSTDVLHKNGPFAAFGGMRPGTGF